MRKESLLEKGLCRVIEGVYFSGKGVSQTISKIAKEVKQHQESDPFDPNLTQKQLDRLPYKQRVIALIANSIKREEGINPKMNKEEVYKQAETLC